MNNIQPSVSHSMHADPQLKRLAAVPAHTRGVTVALAVVIALAWVLAVYARTTHSMVSLWQDSEMFSHGFVVIPIALFLIWRQRRSLSRIEPTPFFPGLIAIAAAGVVWLIGDRLSINSVTQYAMMAMVPLTVLTVLGTRALKTLAFPLAFLFLAVPFGDFMVPQLMGWTADFTVLALQASGIPVLREGNYLMIPSGRWAVVEACSGVRYLIASFTVGCLFAYVSYRSAKRRAAFIAASIVVPIVANWVRAYLIVMLGHLTDNRIAVGADHLVYGWVFFGFVMLLLFWIGSRWQEGEHVSRADRELIIDAPRYVTLDPRTVTVLIGSAVLTALWPLLAMQFAAQSVSPGGGRLTTLSGQNGWSPAQQQLSDWRPDVSSPNAELRQTFVKEGLRVGLHIAFYRDPTRESKGISSVNQLVRTSNPQWRQVASKAVAIDTGAQSFRAQTAVVAREPTRLAVWQWFWVDGRVTGNMYVAKLYEVLSMLRGRGDATAWVVIYAATDDGDPEVHPALRAFATDMSESINNMLRQAAETR